MPSRVHRHVDFDPTPDYSRLPYDDEIYVMKAFARHAAHCVVCADPYDVHRRHGTLCDKGHQRAVDVAKYLYHIGDEAFSLVDRQSNIRVRVEIPAGCEAVRGLLKAMERGLRLRRREPIVSYDENYYVPPRRMPTVDVDTRPNRNYAVETVGSPPPADRRRPRREESRKVGRGSLFEEDMRERERLRLRSRQLVF
jgi:hypothetical protein